MSYEAKDIVTLSQGRAFRMKIGMYLSGDRQEAINLGLRELIVNTQDEYEVFKPKNPFLKITLDTKNRIICVEDNMRGIPCSIRDDGMNSLTAAMLINHSGGKHSGSAYESSVGINGCGNKIVNHTAKWLTVEVHRDGKVYTQKFESDDEGAHPITDVIESKGTNVTGTKITYCPDPKVYGDYFIEIDKLREMLTEISYFSRGLKIELIVDEKEPELFVSQNGLMDGLNHKNALFKPFQYFYKADDCEVELALQWVKKKGKIKGYANGLYMSDGGAFISGFKSSLTRTFNSLANKKFDGDSIRNLLDGFVSVKVKVGQFSNQAKTSLANPEARAATSTAINEALKQFASSRPNDFEAIIVYLDKLNKAEEAADRARNSILNYEKETIITNKKKMSVPIKLMDCEKHGQDSILYITEGKSAKTPVQNARNIRSEAVYDIRGKIISALKNPIDKVLENEEVKDILQILGCGILDKYNEKKLNFGKVLIFSDRDEDGSAISNLIVTLFYVLMPDFIKSGRLGRVIPPLFRMKKGKQCVYFYSNEEYLKEKHKYPNWEITRYKGIGECSSMDFKNTCFNEQEKRIHIYTVNDFTQFEETLNLLMGPEVPQRRDYIFENLDFHKLRSEV